MNKPRGTPTEARNRLRPRPRRQKQKKWELTEAERNQFLTLSLDMLCIASSDGYFKWLNPAFSQTLGWSIDELLARSYVDFVHPDDLAATLAEVQKQVKAGEKVIHFENRYRHKDGLWRVLSWKSVPRGELMYAAARDVTESHRLGQALQDTNAQLEARVAARTAELRGETAERQHTENLLREREALYRQVVELSQESIWIHKAGRIEFANGPAIRMFGFRRLEDLIGQSIFELVHPDDRDRAIGRTKAAIELGMPAALVEMRYLGEGGRVVLVEVQATSFLYNGEIAVMAVGRDITERKQLEDQLRQAQKMEAIGQLTGGIAHDFNNMLGIIIGNLDAVLENLDKDSTQAPAISRALDGALHGAELTKRLLAFARRQPLDPMAFSISGILPDVSAILHRTLGDAISVQVITSDSLWPVFADPSQVQDALVNLAINARDAMPTGGVLTIETANVHLDEDYARQNREVKPGDYVLLAVTDTGAGMPPEVAQRALEPFFTTKPIGKGTGLGLSTIYGFAKQSEGHLKIYSEVGHGTCVKLYLPRAQSASVAAGTATKEPAELPCGTETILVAEDYEELRRMVRDQLSSLGYRIVEAKNGEAALDILRGSDPIDLLFTDVIMSGQITGHDLIREARNCRPGLQVLLTTGYTEKAITTGNGNAHFLRKPYRKQDLALKIRNVLDLR